jgi:hypothetical protein
VGANDGAEDVSGIACAARTPQDKRAEPSRRPAAKERIVLLMECFGNFNLAQIAANAAAQKIGFTRIDA